MDVKRALQPVLLGSALLAGAAALSSCASDLTSLGPQQVLRCDLARARQSPGPASGPMLTPLVRGSFTPIPLETVQFLDKAATDTVTVQSLAARRTESDAIQVMARFANCSRRPVQIEARTSFLGDGPPEPTSAWRRVYLEPSATGVYDEVSLSSRVNHYLVEVRMGR